MLLSQNIFCGGGRIYRILLIAVGERVKKEELKERKLSKLCNSRLLGCSKGKKPTFIMLSLFFQYGSMSFLIHQDQERSL